MPEEGLETRKLVFLNESLFLFYGVVLGLLLGLGTQARGAEMWGQSDGCDKKQSAR